MRPEIIFMNKTSLILKYFQKSDQLVVGNKEYQKTLSSFFQWLTENDKITDDKTTKYFPDLPSKAKIITKQEGILSGIEEIEFLLEKYTPLNFKSLMKDGSQFKSGAEVAEITGKSHKILSYERTILNILQRMSGISTETYRLINLINTSHVANSSDRGHLLQVKPPFIAATRKTPWMSLDKKAVAVGGGLTHRLNLSDGILIKDNHLTSTSIKTSIKLLMNKYQNELIEIEVENEKEAHNAIKIFQNLTTHNHLTILLDNFTPANAKKLLRDLPRRKAGLNNLYDLSEIIIEASGGIENSNILEWAQTGVDIISLGELTHSPQALNLSMEVV